MTENTSAMQINGYTTPSVQVLREMITKNGGEFHAYLDNKHLVTHIIATNLTPAKVKEFKHMKVVRPAWIVQSVEAGVLLNWRDFILTMGSRVEAGQGKKAGQINLFQTTQGAIKRASGLSMSSPATSSIPKGFVKAPETPVLDPRSQLEQETTAAGEAIVDPVYVTDPGTMDVAQRVPGYAFNKSNEAAKRLMDQQGWRKDNTAASGSTFIKGYYQNSRLHHLSTWKAELKDLVAKAQERIDEETFGPATASGVSMRGSEIPKSWQTTPSRKGKERAIEGAERVVMHCDFDCFFVSAGLIERPELRDKPTVVCHSQGRGEGVASTSEIASCSYAARDKGVKNGMRYVSRVMNRL